MHVGKTESKEGKLLYQVCYRRRFKLPTSIVYCPANIMRMYKVGYQNTFLKNFLNAILSKLILTCTPRDADFSTYGIVPVRNCCKSYCLRSLIISYGRYTRDRASFVVFVLYLYRIYSRQCRRIVEDIRVFLSHPTKIDKDELPWCKLTLAPCYMPRDNFIKFSTSIRKFILPGRRVRWFWNLLHDVRSLQ